MSYTANRHNFHDNPIARCTNEALSLLRIAFRKISSSRNKVEKNKPTYEIDVRLMTNLMSMR